MTQLVLLSVFMGVSCMAEQLESNKSSVTLAVYYESYCPDCVDFLRDQLHPTWKKLKQQIKLDLVPYGNAAQTYNPARKTWTFFCQHGRKECTGNILQACAIHQACDSQRTLRCPLDQLEKVLSYINCQMREQYQTKSSDKCANESGLNGTTIMECATGKLGNELENLYGNLTTAVPGYAYTPFIVINGKHTEDDNDKAETDLTKLLCEKK